MKILIIAPYYAPNSEVASVRMISLSKQLVLHGYDVNVLCYSKEVLMKWQDEKELQSKIPEGVNVINYSINFSSIPLFADIFNGKKFLKTIKKIDLSYYDVCFITCGPFYTLKAVKYIKKHVKVLLDFRDLGALEIRPRRRIEKKDNIIKGLIKSLYINMSKSIERKAVSLADKVIVVSQIDYDIMQMSYKISSNKMVLASNGYDGDLLDSLTFNPISKEKIYIGVFGKFMYYSQERAISILKAIDKHRKNGVDITLLHIGRKWPWIMETIEKEKIDPLCYEGHGVMDYSNGMQLLSKCKFFAVEDTSPDDVGTKIYDYIYFNRPVIVSAPTDIPLSKMVSQFENGFVCSTELEVNRAIDYLLKNNPSTLDSKFNKINYSRRSQNEIICKAIIDVFEEKK